MNSNVRVASEFFLTAMSNCPLTAIFCKKLCHLPSHSSIINLFAAPNGKYWTVDGEKKLSANGSTPFYFVIELTQASRIALKPEVGGGYVTSDHVGIMSASGEAVDKSTLWEY